MDNNNNQGSSKRDPIIECNVYVYKSVCDCVWAKRVGTVIDKRVFHLNPNQKYVCYQSLSANAANQRIAARLSMCFWVQEVMTNVHEWLQGLEHQKCMTLQQKCTTFSRLDKAQCVCRTSNALDLPRMFAFAFGFAFVFLFGAALMIINYSKEIQLAWETPNLACANTFRESELQKALKAENQSCCSNPWVETEKTESQPEMTSGGTSVLIFVIIRLFLDFQSKRRSFPHVTISNRKGRFRQFFCRYLPRRLFCEISNYQIFQFRENCKN